MASSINLDDSPAKERGNEALIEIDSNNGRDFYRGQEAGTMNIKIDKDGHVYSTTGKTRRTISLNLGDIAANSDAFRYPIFQPYDEGASGRRIDITIEDVKIGVDTTVAADATNYQTIALKDGNSGNTIVSGTTAAGLTGGALTDLGTISSTYNDVDPADGDYLYLTFTKTESGKALSGFHIQIIFVINAQPNVSSNTGNEHVFEFVNEPEATAIVTLDHTHRDFINFKKDGVSVFRVDIDGFVHTTSNDKIDYLIANLGAIDCDADDAKVCALLTPANDILIKKIYVGVKTTHALASDANYETIKILNDTNTVAEFTTSGPQATGLAMTYGKFYELNIADTPDALVTSSDALKVSFTATGTGGTDLAGFTIQICFERKK